MAKRKPINIAVIGGGSWATALVKILSEHNVKVRWWLKNKDNVKYIIKYRHNPSYLSDIQINTFKVVPSFLLPVVIKRSDIVIIAIPAAFIKDEFNSLKPSLFDGKVIVSAVKGMIPDENLLVTDYIQKEFNVSPENLCVIAGPCHAEEVAQERQSFLTIACQDIANAKTIAKLLKCRYIYTTAINDIYGVEYCAVIKNIVALACGITHGLNYGDNFQAVLVSNALQEIRRFLDVINPLDRDLSASAYLGDLVVTAYSQFSRNRTFGNMIGRGYSVKSAQMEMNMVAEGYYAVKSIHEINQQHKVDMPVSAAVYQILYEKIAPAVEIKLLIDKLK
ncbi:MAG: NAD(P)H-dependent glycerol-3-phosphate dehydrogenase [Cytophagales bacterium]|nr:NAD(P)H-dependent glycerol-3-phosphate dehydrogenase [Cytophagales bacterium]